MATGTTHRGKGDLAEGARLRDGETGRTTRSGGGGGKRAGANRAREVPARNLRGARMARAHIEWPTLGLLAACYAAWAFGTTVLSEMWLPLGIAITALSVTLFSSLQHETIHGHPFRDGRLNAALVFPALGLLIPYLRFRDTHLDHHADANLTDPYDDPETNYLDPATWKGLSRPVRAALAFNNTLIGRIAIGALVSQIAFAMGDLRLALRGDRRTIIGWLLHVPALAPVVLWLWSVAAMPFWAYLCAAYAGLSIVKIRTFLEHRAHERARERTAIIEDRGPLALLFLNNNLHAVHHMHPKLPWYRLPGRYYRNAERYRERNGGYVYRSYGEIFRRHLFRAKDPVPHPLWPSS